MHFELFNKIIFHILRDIRIKPKSKLTNRTFKYFKEAIKCSFKCINSNEIDASEEIISDILSAKN